MDVLDFWHLFLTDINFSQNGLRNLLFITVVVYGYNIWHLSPRIMVSSCWFLKLSKLEQNLKIESWFHHHDFMCPSSSAIVYRRRGSNHPLKSISREKTISYRVPHLKLYDFRPLFFYLRLFINYVDRILGIFDPLPPPCWQVLTSV